MAIQLSELEQRRMNELDQYEIRCTSFEQALIVLCTSHGQTLQFILFRHVVTHLSVQSDHHFTHVIYFNIHHLVIIIITGAGVIYCRFFPSYLTTCDES